VHPDTLQFRPEQIAAVPFSKRPDRWILVNPTVASWVIVDQEALDCLRGGAINKISVKQRELLVRNSIITSSTSNHREGPASHIMSPAPHLAVFHVTDNCNLACKYCYADAGREFNLMSIETAKAGIDFAIQSRSRRINLLLHGGEPLLCGAEWLEEFCKHVKRARKNHPEKDIRLRMQTNGTLLTDDYCRILAANGFHVSLSLDGPKDINDKVRPFRVGGDSSTDKVINAVRLLKKYNLSRAAISTVTSYNHYRLDEVALFLDKLGFSAVKFNCVYGIGRGAGSDCLITPQQYFNAIKKVVQLRMDDRIKMMVAPINYLLQNLLDPERRYMCMKSPCGASNNVLSFDAEGKVYPCDDLLNTAAFSLGDVFTCTMDEVLRSNLSRKFRERVVNRITGCKTCVWRAFCGSCCPAQVLLTKGDMMRPSNLCEYYKRIFPYLIESLYNEKIKTLKLLIRRDKLESGD